MIDQKRVYAIHSRKEHARNKIELLTTSDWRFMRKELLELIPVAFLCPFCGEWHSVKEPRSLKAWKGGSFKPDFRCEDCVGCDECPGHRYWVYIHDEYVHYFVDGVRGKISVSDIREDSDKSRVVFTVPTSSIPYSKINPYCDFLQKDSWRGHATPKGVITLGLEFQSSEFGNDASSEADSTSDTPRSLWGSQYD